jgi:hypothetical protein
MAGSSGKSAHHIKVTRGSENPNKVGNNSETEPDMSGMMDKSPGDWIINPDVDVSMVETVSPDWCNS